MRSTVVVVLSVREVRREQQNPFGLRQRDQLFAVVVIRGAEAQFPEPHGVALYANGPSNVGAAHSGRPELLDGFHGYEL